MKEICEQCGQFFLCQLYEPSGCWCTTLPSVMNVPAAGSHCLCPSCLSENVKEREKAKSKPQALEKDVDYYIEGGKWVFTAHFHAKRGYCCGSGCRHCPYPLSLSDPDECRF